MLLSRYRFAVAILAGVLASDGAVAQEPAARPAAEGASLRDDYEAERPTWQQEYTDTTVRLLTHERSDRAAHGGRQSERFVFDAAAGTGSSSARPCRTSR